MDRPPLPPFDLDTATRSARLARVSDLPIAQRERLFHWPHGRRPDAHASPGALGL